MSTETGPVIHTHETKQSIGLFTVIVATVTLFAVRASGFAALPYIVIFAPILTVAAVLILVGVLGVLAAVLTSGEESK